MAQLFNQATADLPRIVSTNLCADQLLLLLAEPQQILSLSHISRDEQGAHLYQQALRYPVNHGNSEAIYRLQPDVVLAGRFGTHNTVALLRQLDIKVEILDVANSLQDVYRNIRIVAAAAQQQQRGENMITTMQQRLQAMTKTDKTLPAAVYDPNGYTVGTATLRGEMLELAGWENIAGRLGITSYGSLSLESLLRLNPVAIVESPYSPGTFSRAQQMTSHPALRSQNPQRTTITLAASATICGGPWTVDAIEKLRQARIAIQSGAPD